MPDTHMSHIPRLIREGGIGILMSKRITHTKYEYYTTFNSSNVMSTVKNAGKEREKQRQTDTERELREKNIPQAFNLKGIKMYECHTII